MRSRIDRRMVSEVMRDTHRALASLLLTGTMLAPAVAGLAGWPVHTPLGIPLLAHVAILLALGGLVVVRAAEPVRASRDVGRVRWLLVPPLAVVLAAILHTRANVFYTATALMEGMAGLFALSVAVAMLRERALRPLRPGAAECVAPRRLRPAAEWRHRLRARCLPVTPGVRVADGLTVLVGWILSASWILIAFEHRHVAGPLLLLAGALELLALFAVVPDALAGIAMPTPHLRRQT
jgi:hypothetical protein